MSRFADSFWGDNGFDVIDKRLEAGMKSTELFVYYVGERANIEKKYADSLQRLIRNTKDVAEVGSSREAWLALKGETDNLSKLHEEFATSLGKEVGAPLIKFKDDQKKLRKQYLGDAFKLNSEMAKNKKALTLVKDSYVKVSKDAAAQEHEIEKKKAAGAPQKVVNKEIAKLKNLSKVQLKYEKEYQNQVTRLAAFQVEWVEKLSGILEFLQVQEEQRIDALKEHFLKFVDVQRRVAPFMSEACTRILAAAQGIDKNRDIFEFIREYSTGSGKPKPPTFEPFRGGSDGGAAVGGAGAPPMGGGGGGAMGRGGGGGGGGTIAPPSFGGGGGRGGGAPGGGFRGGRGGGPGGARLAPPVAPTGAGGASRARALYDYVGQDNTELDLLAGDIVTVEVKDPSGWWKGTSNGRTGLFPRNYVEEI
mmetsp:Transcript_1101/g.3383  ORF Transcript_1101/g.3383 Transcript_1101/m.3383 type:complete len:420 (-) Transcript_1101:102-1361(-)